MSMSKGRTESSKRATSTHESKRIQIDPPDFETGRILAEKWLNKKLTGREIPSPGSGLSWRAQWGHKTGDLMWNAGRVIGKEFVNAKGEVQGSYRIDWEPPPNPESKKARAKSAAKESKKKGTRVPEKELAPFVDKSSGSSYLDELPPAKSTQPTPKLPKLTHYNLEITLGKETFFLPTQKQPNDLERIYSIEHEKEGSEESEYFSLPSDTDIEFTQGDRRVKDLSFQWTRAEMERLISADEEIPKKVADSFRELRKDPRLENVYKAFAGTKLYGQMVLAVDSGIAAARALDEGEETKDLPPTQSEEKRRQPKAEPLSTKKIPNASLWTLLKGKLALKKKAQVNQDDGKFARLDSDIINIISDLEFNSSDIIAAGFVFPEALDVITAYEVDVGSTPKFLALKEALRLRISSAPGAVGSSSLSSSSSSSTHSHTLYRASTLPLPAMQSTFSPSSARREKLYKPDDKRAATIQAALSTNFEEGAARTKGDCFFDSVAQGLEVVGKAIPGDVKHESYKRLRVLCHQYIQDHHQLSPDKNWPKITIEKDAKMGVSVYQDFLTIGQYTQQEMTEKDRQAKSSGHAFHMMRTLPSKSMRLKNCYVYVNDERDTTNQGLYYFDSEGNPKAVFIPDGKVERFRADLIAKMGGSASSNKHLSDAEIEKLFDDNDCIRLDGFCKGLSTWGRPDIEGFIICKCLGIKLHIIEFTEDEGEFVTGHRLVDPDVDPNTGFKIKEVSAEEIDLTSPEIIHIAIYQSHYTPIFSRLQLTSENTYLGSTARTTAKSGASISTVNVPQAIPTQPSLKVEKKEEKKGQPKAALPTAKLGVVTPELVDTLAASPLPFTLALDSTRVISSSAIASGSAAAVGASIASMAATGTSNGAFLSGTRDSSGRKIISVAEGYEYNVDDLIPGWQRKDRSLGRHK